MSPSPKSSPCHVENASHCDTDIEMDENVFLGPENSSFILSVTSPPQSPRTLPMKYKPATREFLQGMPEASTSVASICSVDGLMTPGVTPEGNSGWPTAVVYDDAGDNQHPYGITNEAEINVDAFIIKTLAGASKGSQLLPKRIPGTPVKKLRISYFGNERPWQSAVASKVGLRDGCDFNKKQPRKSLPAAFPPMGTKPSKSTCDQTTDSEDEQESPIMRRDKYANLGLGQPPLPASKNIVSGIPRSRWLARRSSSGAFSSSSDSASLLNTPTRSKEIGMNIVSVLMYVNPPPGRLAST